MKSFWTHTRRNPCLPEETRKWDSTHKTAKVPNAKVCAQSLFIIIFHDSSLENEVPFLRRSAQPWTRFGDSSQYSGILWPSPTAKRQSLSPARLPPLFHNERVSLLFIFARESRTPPLLSLQGSGTLLLFVFARGDSSFCSKFIFTLFIRFYILAGSVAPRTSTREA